MARNDRAFIRLPKSVFALPLSLEAKVLYALLLDRADLSVQNGWLDPDGQVFLYFSPKQICQDLGCGHNKATAVLRELESSGLIRRRRQGQGRPAKIYVPAPPKADGPGEGTAPRADIRTAPEEAVRNAPEGGPAPEEEAWTAPEGEPAPEEEAWTARDGESRLPITGPVDFPLEAANHTEENHTERNKTHRTPPLTPPWRHGETRMEEMRLVKETIQENIDYDFLIQDRPQDQPRIDGYVELMAEACCPGRDTVRIGGRDLPAGAVRERLMQLDAEHIRYVRDCLSKSTAAIRNIKAYTLAALYNAPVTMEQYYDALVSRDMAV